MQDKNNLSQGTKSGEQLARVPLSTWESSETPKVFPKQIQDEPPAAKHTFRGCPAGLFSCLISLLLTPVHISKAPTPGPPLGASEMTIRSSLQGGPEHRAQVSQLHSEALTQGPCASLDPSLGIWSPLQNRCHCYLVIRILPKTAECQVTYLLPWAALTQTSRGLGATEAWLGGGF